MSTETESVGPARRRRLRPGLGTWVAIEAAAPSRAEADVAIEAAFAAVLAVERRMHPTRPGSDLASINTASAGTRGRSRGPITGPTSLPVAVDASTWELLSLAKRLCAVSGGVFDPCLPCCPGRLCDIELLPLSRVLSHKPVSLDFGGFAKGYAIDGAVEALLGHGCSAGLVNAGGDLRVFGPEPQTVLLRAPGGRFHALELTNAAIAVSNLSEDRRPAGHQGYYRRAEGILDSDTVKDVSSSATAAVLRPRAPRATRRTAAVIAKEAVIADAMTKCALLCSQEQLDRIVRRWDAGISIGAQRSHCPSAGSSGDSRSGSRPLLSRSCSDR